MLKITKDKILLGGIVCSIGTYKTFNDYKKAEKEDKKNTLIRDTFILAGTAAGAYCGHKFLHLKQNPNSKKIVKFLKILFNNLSVPVSGIITGIICGEISDKKFPVKSKDEKIKETVKNEIKKGLLSGKSIEQLNNIGQMSENIDPGALGKAYSYLGIATGSLFDDGFAVMPGFNVGREKGIKNKILRASYEIISGEIIPISIIISTASFLNKKNIAGYKKNLIIAPIAIAGCFLGNQAAQWFNKAITENLLKDEFYKQIYEKQKNLILFSIANQQNINEMLPKLEQLNFLKKNVNNIVKTQKNLKKEASINTTV